MFNNSPVEEHDIITPTSKMQYVSCLVLPLQPEAERGLRTNADKLSNKKLIQQKNSKQRRFAMYKVYPLSNVFVLTLSI